MDTKRRNAQQMYVKKFGPNQERTLVTYHPDESIAQTEELRAATLQTCGLTSSMRQSAERPRSIEIPVDQRVQSTLYHRLPEAEQAALVYQTPLDARTEGSTRKPSSE